MTLGPDLQRQPRPSDDDLRGHYRFATSYFELLKANFPPLAEFFDAKDYAKVVAKYRGTSGGHVLFRPAGLLMFTEIISTLHQTHGLKVSVALAATLPQKLNEEPYADLLWTISPPSVNNKRRSLVRELLLYGLGAREKLDRLVEQYRNATGSTVVKASQFIRRLRKRIKAAAKAED